MRILITLIAVVAFLGTTSAQDVAREKKRSKKARTEAAVTPVSEAGAAAAPKAGCCAGKTASAQAACGSKTADAKTASGETSTSNGTTDAPKSAGCCAGKSAEAKASCQAKGEAHAHDHEGGAVPAADPAVAPND